MSSNRFFLKYVLIDNHWVGNSEMKPVDAMEFEKIKALGEGKVDKSNNFDIEILGEGVLDKALEGPGKTLNV